MIRYLNTFLTLALLLVCLPVAAPKIHASEPPTTSGVRVVPQGDAVLLQWADEAASARTQATRLPDLPLVDIGGARLPAHIVALRVPPGVAVVPQLDEIERIPWTGDIPAAEVPIPRTLTGEERPDLAAAPTHTLPSSPVSVLRESLVRGQRIVVLAFSPLFAQDGQVYAATQLQATIPDATILSDHTGVLQGLHDQPPASTPALTIARAPTNALAAQEAVKIRVARAGIQRISGARLAAAGLDIQNINPANILLHHNGEPVPLEEHGTTDGTLDADDELRFYAPTPGDRWNATDTYWLTLGESAGPRMSVRAVEPGTASLRTRAFEEGVWRNNTVYDTTLPGPDGDHWFTADLLTGPAESATTVITLTPELPAVTGTSLFTLTGSAYTTGTHRLVLSRGSASDAASWQGVGDWSQSFVLPASNDPYISVELLPETGPSGVLLDSVAWQRLAALDMGGNGAAFTGAPGMWRYQLSGVAADSALYDVSTPTAPQRLAVSGEAPTTFEDGPTSRRYILAGDGTLHSVEVISHTPVNLAAPLNADAVYIAPAAFHAALEPLRALRQSQGYTVAVVDVQAIYDAWSYGQVSPEAIRSFLRYAAATWNPAPVAALLVGDGTSDPLNYTGRDNINFLPPYLAMVDPWLGEAACDTCYARLDGDSPLDDPLPDLMIGRLPAKSAAEVETLVAKIIGYETSKNGAWRSRVVYIADNYIKPSGATDPAGDFAASSDASAALHPPGMFITRIYYDPSSDHSKAPWREPDATRANQRVIDALDAGAGIVMYTGHSHHWQWASTETEPSHLLQLYDVDKLTNAEQLPVVLAMTCLSSAFQQPARSGTTLDERLFVHPDGGAAAVWGPTGLGVSYGHDSLQRGFYQALWATMPTTPTLGMLTMAGYTELFTRGVCCQDSLRTFVLFGDPLTQVRITEAHPVYVPVMRR